MGADTPPPEEDLDMAERPYHRAEYSDHNNGKNEFAARVFAADLYAERTQGIGKGIRADREAKARTDALTLALRYADQGPTEIGVGTIFQYADKFAAYILDGTHDA
jgi:hypothetical protein